MSRFPTPRLLVGSLSLGLVACLGATLASAQTQRNVPDYELPPIVYSKATAKDVVSKLQQRFNRGELALDGTGRDLLLRVLHELKVPVESQMVVFSKTSLQKDLITPANPRALYFTDDIYVGWVPGGEIEIAAVDPELGPIFYKLDATDGPAKGKGFVRDNGCMLCHGYIFVRNIPGLFSLTITPDERGESVPYMDQDLVDDRTRFAQRWGGWYVTGYTGKLNHRGNAWNHNLGKDKSFTPSDKRPTELSAYFDTSRYPAATSDALPLLIAEHQMSVTNSIIRAGQQARRMDFYSASDILDRLLFRRSAALPEGVSKNAAFVQAFNADVKRTRAGQSLKDLALDDGQLFRNRCSYLIYSATFIALPEKLKHEVLDGLYTALRDDSAESRYAYLPKDERARIYDILVETHPEARQRFERMASSGQSQ